MIARISGLFGAVGVALLVNGATRAETNDQLYGEAKAEKAGGSLMASLRKRFEAHTGPVTNQGGVR